MASALEEFKDRDINVLCLGISIFILLQRLSLNMMTKTHEDAFTSHLRALRRMRGRRSIHDIRPASRSSPPSPLLLLPRHAHGAVQPPHSPLVPGEARLHAAS